MSCRPDFFSHVSVRRYQPFIAVVADVDVVVVVVVGVVVVVVVVVLAVVVVQFDDNIRKTNYSSISTFCSMRPERLLLLSPQAVAYTMGRRSSGLS